MVSVRWLLCRLLAAALPYFPSVSVGRLAVLKHGFGQNEVKGSGDFDVLPVAVYHADAVPERLNHRGIVGERLLVRLPESLLGQCDFKDLRRLYNAILAAQHVLSASLSVNVAQGVGHG